MSNIPKHISELKKAVDYQDVEKFAKLLSKNSENLDSIFIANPKLPHIKMNIMQYVISADINMLPEEKDQTIYQDYQDKPFFKMYEELKNNGASPVNLEAMKGFSYHYENAFADVVSQDCIKEIKNQPSLAKEKEVDDLHTAQWMVFAIKHKDPEAVKTIMDVEKGYIFALHEIGNSYGTMLENVSHYGNKEIMDLTLNQLSQDNVNKRIQFYEETPLEHMVSVYSNSSTTKQPLVLDAIHTLIDKGAEVTIEIPKANKNISKKPKP